MENIKTYELFNNLSFFKKKKDTSTDLKYVVEESLIELSDLGFTVEVKMNMELTPHVKIEIDKIVERYTLPSFSRFKVYDVMGVLNFALPLLQKEYGLELWKLTYREFNHIDDSRMNKKHSYSKLKHIKDMETSHIDIILKYRKL